MIWAKDMSITRLNRVPHSNSILVILATYPQPKIGMEILVDIGVQDEETIWFGLANVQDLAFVHTTNIPPTPQVSDAFDELGRETYILWKIFQLASANDFFCHGSGPAPIDKVPNL